jgi:A/G-specific adenine glycosylase
MKETKENLADLLLVWFKVHGRELPWRHRGGAHPDPYAVFVSEFMLQQTTVKTVIPYFARFMAHFPTVNDLAQASLEEVYQLWQGLGYYTRARSLHASAQMIVKDFNGKFPSTREDVLKLKGIGPYSVASILALAFNQPETVIDGNVMRIIARLYHLTEPLEDIKEIVKAKAHELKSLKHPADYASAIMDLGATVCTPKKPQCLICPWQRFCQSYGKDDVDLIPLRQKMLKKEQQGNVYLIYNKKGDVLIRKRTQKGLLSGLYEFPWGDMTFKEAIDSQKEISHIFTHIKLILRIYVIRSDTSPIDDGFFVSPKEFKNYAFSTLMKKVWQNRP